MEQNMVEIGKAFEAVANDFLNSAQTEEQLTLFILIATAAWNISLQAEGERLDSIRVFIERFRCPLFTCKGKTISTRDKIFELCDQKVRMYPELKHVIRSLDVESSEDGLIYSVVSEAVG